MCIKPGELSVRDRRDRGESARFRSLSAELSVRDRGESARFRSLSAELSVRDRGESARFRSLSAELSVRDRGESAHVLRFFALAQWALFL